ncbi:MAG: stage II sporulation protein M [Verrucomicrobiae bacterium]|nr:stage II sporulation protein M [Verrucomicrobiae bacterium]
MIIDLPRFIASERPYWTELEERLDRLERDVAAPLDLAAVARLHYLYRRASSDLGRMMTFSAEPETRAYLEALVSRAYSEIHETRGRPHRLNPLKWFFHTFPNVFRRHLRAFGLACALTVAGMLLGGFSLLLDPASRNVTMAFGHNFMSPSERVAREETQTDDRFDERKGTFSAYLMQNNIRVSITTMALGATWGIGTVVILFYNGVILGSISLDYILDGQWVFLLGWLLPHGVVEIPAILIAGQAGFVLASAIIGWGTPRTLAQRLRDIGPDLATLIGGVALLLIWAGLIESFFSQYHAPVLPYSFKISFGLVELLLLCLFLGFSGSNRLALFQPPTPPEAA